MTPSGVELRVDRAGIVEKVDEQLADPNQTTYAKKRARHMEVGVQSDGNAAATVAKALARLANDAKPDFTSLSVGEKRRGFKLRCRRDWVNPAITILPFLGQLFPTFTNCGLRRLKTISPCDVRNRVNAFGNGCGSMKILLAKLNHLGDTLLLTTIGFLRRSIAMRGLMCKVRSGCEGFLKAI